VQIPDSPSLKPTNVSVEAWVKLDTLVTPGANIPGQQIIVFKKNTRGGNFEGYVLLKDRVGGTDCFSLPLPPPGDSRSTHFPRRCLRWERGIIWSGHTMGPP